MSEQKTVWLQDLTWEEVEQYLQDEDIILFPIGSTEQHGPAGVLGLDSYTAIALAEDAARDAGVLTTPPLWFGDSLHHLQFPGSISLQPETLTAVAKDVIRSLAGHGFRKILLINGHRGTNLAALSTACRSLHENELPGVLLALADPLHLSRGIVPEIKEAYEHHSGELELSQLWYNYPHLVRENKLTAERVNVEQDLSPFAAQDLCGWKGDTIEVFWSSGEQRKFAPSGSFADSSKSSREKGRRYHEYMVGNLVRFINWMREYDGCIGRDNN